MIIYGAGSTLHGQPRTVGKSGLIGERVREGDSRSEGARRAWAKSGTAAQRAAAAGAETAHERAIPRQAAPWASPRVAQRGCWPAMLVLKGESLACPPSPRRERDRNKTSGRLMKPRRYEVTKGAPATPLSIQERVLVKSQHSKSKSVSIGARRPRLVATH